MTNINLQNLCVLVTRPPPQGKVLCQRILAHGGQPIYLPTIYVTPAEDQAALKTQINHLEQYDWIVFISPQAVYQTVALLHECWPEFPSHVRVAAVGVGTAQVLLENNIPVTAYPEQEWSSEGLLKLPAFAEIKGQQIALVRGEGGRELLADTLTERGAIVTPIIAYRRSIAEHVDLSEVNQAITENKLQAIIITSGDSLTSLMALLNEKYQATLLKIPLIVISERLQKIATDFGFELIYMAENVSHDAILNALVSIVQSRGKSMSSQPSEVKEVTTPKNTNWRGLGILLSGLASALLVAIVFYASYSLLSIDKQLATELVKLKNGFVTTQNVISDAQKAADTNAQSVQQVSDQIKNQAQVIADLQQAQHANKDSYMTAEAQYLVNMANDNLVFGNNIPLALRLLQSADQEVAKLSDPRLYKVREALSADVVALQGAEVVDTAGIYARLAALNQQIDKLPIINSKFVSEAATSSVGSDKQNQSWWRTGLNATMSSLSQVVVVRKGQTNVPPFIAPNQQAFYYQNLHAEIEKAQWALLHRQNDIYQSCLQQAQEWIKQYTVANSPESQQMMNALADLKKINVNPAVPTVSNTLQAFQAYTNG